MAVRNDSKDKERSLLFVNKMKQKNFVNLANYEAYQDW